MSLQGRRPNQVSLRTCDLCETAKPLRSALRLISLLSFLFCAAVWGAQPRIQIDSPRGGEFFIEGQKQTVQVTTRLKTIKIELSRDGGHTFTEIGQINSASTDLTKRNALDWTVTLPASTQCVIRATSGAFTVSSGTFVIIPSVGNVSTLQIADGSVTQPKLATKAVSSDKINSGQASPDMTLTADGSGNAQWMSPQPAGSVSATSGDSVIAALNNPATTATINPLRLPIAGTTAATAGIAYADNSSIIVGPDGKLSAVAGTGTPPAGANTQVQFNDAGLFGADVSFSYDKLAKRLTLSGTNGAALALTGAPVATSTASLLQMGAPLLNGSANGTWFGMNAPGGFSGNLADFEVGGTSVFNLDASGNLNLTGTISSVGNLTLQETGDQYGTVRFSLQNRNGVNGVLFEQAGSVDLVDFVLKGLNNQRNIRYENRAPSAFAAAPEFEFGVPADPTLCVSDFTTFVRKGSLGIGTPTFGTNNLFLVNAYNTVDNAATAQITTRNANNKVLVVQGAAGQSANLQEWQNSDGSLGSYISPTGSATFIGSIMNENTTQPGVHVGYSPVGDSPRVLFCNGNSAQNWEIDQVNGIFRWYTPGVLHMSLDTGGNLTTPGTATVGGFNLSPNKGAGRILTSDNNGTGTWQDPSKVAVTTQSSNYTVSTSDRVVLANAAGGAFAVTLPPVASTGYQFTIKKTDASANAVTVQGNGADLIDGQNTYVLPAQFNFVTVVSDGTSWNIVAR